MKIKNPSDAKPKSKEPFSVASTERLSNVPRSAVRPDAHRRKVLNGKNLGEDIQLCGATTEKIVGSSPIDTRHIPSASLDKIFEKWERKMSTKSSRNGKWRVLFSFRRRPRKGKKGSDRKQIAEIVELKAELPSGLKKLIITECEQARLQGREECIAEIEPIIIEMANLDKKQIDSYQKNPDVIATVRFETNWDLLLRKIASMKKEVGKDG